MPAWLEDTVFYEIYPQSFYDSNGDGIGDIQGIIEKLDYVDSLGCNAIWINPCFDSPFRDGGYDIRDYKKVAPRYGTNEDLVRCFNEAHKRGLRVLLDLVPGHTSEEHPWFVDSCKADPDQYRDRYIWTGYAFQNADGLPCICGESRRNGAYVLNYFKCQPALNYGFYERQQDWQLPVDHPACIATREALKDIMRFWLNLGCDGFRVDMAASLVKNDGMGKPGTVALWQNIRKMLDAEYPEAALVSEWGNPEYALKAGFHMDFYLNEHRPDCGYRSLMRDYDGAFYNRVRNDKSYFNKESQTDILTFLNEYLPRYEKSKGAGFISLHTGNHDILRPRANLDMDELKLAYAFLFTMPGVPFLYYGDEIGMRYLDLPTKEGGYHRTGSRTPMQWNQGANKGFSSAEEDELYLPVDSFSDAPTVEAQGKQASSLLNTVKQVLTLRHRYNDLQASSPFEVVFAEQNSRLFVYRRGRITIGINPGGGVASFVVPPNSEVLLLIGACFMESNVLKLQGQSFVALISND